MCILSSKYQHKKLLGILLTDTCILYAIEIDFFVYRLLEDGILSLGLEVGTV